jgi:hypothetical protein
MMPAADRSGEKRRIIREKQIKKGKNGVSPAIPEVGGQGRNEVGGQHFVP